jgi:hypothetical protein
VSLDPRQVALEKFLADTEKRQKRIYDLNHLEPPFPWKVIAFNPGTFGLDAIPDQKDPRFIQV